MALPTCECVGELPQSEKLSAIYCALYTLAQGDVDGPYLLKSENLADVNDSDAARTNIDAAKIGENSDITSLLAIGSGLVGSPSITVGSATNGFYAPAANQIGISTGGTNAGTWANGKLGIGVTPTSGASGTGTFQVGNTTPPNIGTAWTAYFYNSSFGRVGIDSGVNNAAIEFLESGTRQWLMGSSSGAFLFYNNSFGEAFNISTANLATFTAAVLFNGNVSLDKTITAAGTTGARTINKNAGSVNFAAAATSLVVTDSRVTTSSVIVATVATNDLTMKSVNAVAGSGSFTLNANAAATAETRVNFLIIN